MDVGRKFKMKYFYIGLYIDSEPSSSLDNAFIRGKAFLFDRDTAVES